MGMTPSLDCPARVASLYVLQLKVYRRSPRIWIKFGECASKLVFDLGSFHQSLSLITIGREDFFPVPSGNVHHFFQSLALLLKTRLKTSQDRGVLIDTT
jgi:hypothetical protein